MNEQQTNKVVEKISSSRGISFDDAMVSYTKLVEDTVFQIKLVNSDIDEGEARERALTTITNRFFPPANEASGGGSGKRLSVMKGCLLYMLQEREETRTKINPKGAARFLHDSGLRTTKSGNPDPKSVGDALGIEGIGLVKQPDSTYPIPTKPEHFISNANRGLTRPSPEESTLDALCRKYGVQSSLIREH